MPTTSRKLGMLFQDPSYPELMGNHEFDLARDFLAKTGSARFEIRDELADGSPRFPVVDWANPALDLSVHGMMSRAGNGAGSLAAMEEWPQFHQVNLFAVADYALGFVEHELGQAITWQAKRPLILRPHAFEQENAYYDPNDGSLNFGHFWSEFHRKTIWTCLSHDTIAHELGHAILSALRPLFDYSPNPEVGAFHECFADLIAMFACLGHEKVAAKFLPNAAALDQPNIVSELSEEFGAGLFGKNVPYLRSALNRNTYDPAVTEPHDASEVLTGAIYEILCGLIRQDASKDPFSRKVTHAIERVRGMFLRSLSYLPPTGVTLPQFAAILLKADEMVFPAKKDAPFRTLAEQVFTRRELLASNMACDAPRIDGKWIREAAAQSTEALMRCIHAHRQVLQIPEEALIVRAWMRETQRNADHLQQGKAKRSILAIQEFYLYYTYEVVVRGEEFTFSGTLVFSSDWKALCWITDPARADGENLRSACKRRAAQIRAAAKEEGLTRVLGMAEDWDTLVEAQDRQMRDAEERLRLRYGGDLPIHRPPKDPGGGRRHSSGDLPIHRPPKDKPPEPTNSKKNKPRRVF